jgi:hypothetical protein
MVEKLIVADREVYRQSSKEITGTGHGAEVPWCCERGGLCRHSDLLHRAVSRLEMKQGNGQRNLNSEARAVCVCVCLCVLNVK